MSHASRHTCRVCLEPFAEADHLALHLGRAHDDALDSADGLAYDEAVAREEAWLANLQRHVKAAWFALPVFLFYVFTVALLLEMDGNPAWMILVTPGYVAFAALVYGMAFTRFQLKDSGRLGPGGRGTD